MIGHRIYATSVASVYRHYVAKAEGKERSKAEVDEGYLLDDRAQPGHTGRRAGGGNTFEDFFDRTPAMNAFRSLITGTVCGVRVETVEEPLMREIRYLDKLVDELAKGRAMAKILRPT